MPLKPGQPIATIPHALHALVEAAPRISGNLGRLISVDTSFPPGAGYDAFAALLEELVAPLGFETRHVVVPRERWDPGDGSAWGERVNVVAARRTGRPVVSLYFHVDTVPPGDGWTRPPFALTEDSGRLYGRGAADMKGAIAAAIAALRAARDADLSLAYDPVLLLCTDEEGGLCPGIRHLAEEGLIEGHLLSFNGQAAPRLYAGSFGSLDLRIELKGRAAHSGDPEGGVNAVEEALPLLAALRDLKECIERRRSTLADREGRPLRARLNVTAARGGEKGSALPGSFALTLNRRYAPEEPFEDVLAELERTVDGAVAGSGLLGHATRVVGHLPPVSDPLGPHWPRWQAALSQGFGWPVESFRAYGSSTSSDMGWAQPAGVREILLGGLTRPGCGAHGADEHTTLADIVALARSILLYLSRDFEPEAIPEFTDRSEETA